MIIPVSTGVSHSGGFLQNEDWRGFYADELFNDLHNVW